MLTQSQKIELEILRGNYWENWKFAKDLAFILPLHHWKREALEKSINQIQQQIFELEKFNTE